MVANAALPGVQNFCPFGRKVHGADWGTYVTPPRDATLFHATWNPNLICPASKNPVFKVTGSPLFRWLGGRRWASAIGDTSAPLILHLRKDCALIDRLDRSETLVAYCSAVIRSLETHRYLLLRVKTVNDSRSCPSIGLRIVNY